MVSLMMLLMAKFFVAGAVVSDATDASVPRIYSHSDRSLVDSSFTTIAGINQPYGGYNGDSILATAARLNFPTEIAFDKAGHLHFMVRNRIRRVDKDTGIITTVVGTEEYSFNGDSIMAVYASLTPSGFTFDTFGDMFVSDVGGRIRKITPASGLITTVAGNGIFGYNGDGILATRATLASPRTITSDSLGNLYFIDESNYRIRKITRSTGLISTVVGNGEGSDLILDGFLATSGSIRPVHLVIDTSGNLYTTDRISNNLLRVSLSTGYVTSVRWFAAADFFFLDALDNLYWSRNSDKLILKKPISNDGETIVATNVYSRGFYVDANGAMYISLCNENTIIKIVPNGNIASFPTHMPTFRPTGRATFPPTSKYDSGFLTVAGIDDRWGGYNGDEILATTAKLSSPGDITFDGMGGDMYIADSLNSRVRKVNIRTGVISTVVGSGDRGFTGDGTLATGATMSYPRRVIFDVYGDMLILADLRVRKVTTLTGIITTVAGNGTSNYHDGNVLATSASIGMPRAIACDSTGNLYISDHWNMVVWKVDKSTGMMNVVYGNRRTGVYVMGGYYSAYITAMAFDNAGDLYLIDSNLRRVMKVTISTGVIQLFYPRVLGGTSMFLDRQENLFYADPDVGQICKITKSTGVVTIVAKNQYFSGGISMDVDGNIYVAGTERNAVFKVNLLTFPEIVPIPTATPTSTPTVTPTAHPTNTVATGVIAGIDLGDVQGGYNGDGILATLATLWNPSGGTFDEQGNMYIADSTNSRIRRVDKSTGIITTIAGTGEWRYGGDGSPAILAQLNNPTHIIFDELGNLFISDSQNDRIRKITTSTGIITTVVGNGQGPYNGEDILGTAASVNYPAGLAFDAEGNLFYVDTYNSRIRKLTKSTGIVKTVAGNGVYGSNEASVDNLIALNAKISPYSLTIDAAGDLYFFSSQESGICKLTMSTGIIKTTKIDNYPSVPFIDGFGNMYYSTRNYNDNASLLHKISVSNGITTIVASRPEKFSMFHVDDASGDIYFIVYDKNIILKASYGRSITAYPTHEPTSLSAPPTLSPVMITAPPTRSPVMMTAPPTRSPITMTAPPTRSPVMMTAPPNLSPVMITAPPSLNPTKPPLNKPSLRPNYQKPSRAPLGKPPRKSKNIF